MESKDPVIDIDYQKVFESSPSLFLLLLPNSPDFTIIGVSEKYLAATLTQRNEIIHKKLFDVFPDNPQDLTANGVSNLRQSLERVVTFKKQDIMPTQKYDIPLPVNQGGGFEERFWDPKNTPVLNDDNSIAYIIHKVEDVTANVLLQKEVQRKSNFIKENEDRINIILNALLKYTTMDFSDKLVVSEKGDELDAIICGLNSLIEELEEHTNLLRDANNELEYANKELDSFSYSVSHDLRAPLRAINGYSQVLLEDYGGQLDDNGKHTIDVIIRNAQKMGALIDDLLTFSRVGKQSLTKLALNIEKLVGPIVAEFTALPHINTVEFRVAHLENVEGDSSMLKQVFANLISNAVKYSGKKTNAIIDIGSFKKNDSVVYYVKDNGTGFDMKYYGKLFNVFQRLHSSYEFEGTGVGLALVQRIIKKHNGEVWAEAELEKGATFYFSLPIKY
ncbi:MAG: ATP-binding protein [Bacteroidota bacterium]